MPTNLIPTDKETLYELGVSRVNSFCKLNGLPECPVTAVPDELWVVNACAFYRPDTEIERKHRLKGHGPCVNVSIERCQRPAGEVMSRNWSWPGSTVDRTPFGVVCHELGHHADYHTGQRKGRYYSEYCEECKARAGEPGLTSYAEENPAEWFAEAFRLFVTNPDLLRYVRPETYTVLREKFKPVVYAGWRVALGSNVPQRVVKSLLNKGAK